MSNHFLFMLLGLLTALSPVQAQQQTVFLPQNTEVNLELTEVIQANEVLIGKLVLLLVTTDVKSEEQVAIALGATGYGRIRSIVPGSDGTEDGFLLEPVSCFTVDGQFLSLQGETYNFTYNPLEQQFEQAQGDYMKAQTLQPLKVNVVAVPPSDTLQVPIINDPQPESPQPLEEETLTQNRVLLIHGIEVPLVMSDECIPSDLNEGQVVKLRVKQDVIERGKLVFSARAPAFGKVKHLTDNKIYVEAVAAVAVDGQHVVLETDRSIVVEFDPELEDEVLYLESDIPALVAVRIYVAAQ
jgi:hypothetical protein